jgi:hypothetical protein
MIAKKTVPQFPVIGNPLPLTVPALSKRHIGLQLPLTCGRNNREDFPDATVRMEETVPGAYDLDGITDGDRVRVVGIVERRRQDLR